MIRFLSWSSLRAMLLACYTSEPDSEIKLWMLGLNEVRQWYSNITMTKASETTSSHIRFLTLHNSG